MSDMQRGELYKCNVFNPEDDVTVGGSYSRLQITPGSTSVISTLSGVIMYM